MSTVLPRTELVRRSWCVLDLACWVVAVYVATWLRFDFEAGKTLVVGTMVSALTIGALHVALGMIVGPYAVGHLRGSFEEIVDIARTVLVSTVAGFVAVYLLGQPYAVPRTVPLIAGGLALAAMLVIRFTVRTWRTRPARGQTQLRRVIVFGAGEGGRQLLRTMVHAPDSGLVAVAILDDDRRKARLHIEGVRVRGRRHAMQHVAATTGADTLVIAVPSADAALIRDLRSRAEVAGLQVLTLPPISEILGGRPTTTDLRDVDLNDLLGRRPVTLDTELISEQIAGRVILVTGAGGSIGSELCRQIMHFEPAKLYLLDRDESGLQATKLSLTGSGLLETDDIILADIRDLESLRAAFGKTAPEIVFHAAALKHLPLLEAYPLEAWKSNVLGTLNVLTASSESGVQTFVNISTDKAADPTCVLGYSKRLAEQLTATFARDHQGRFVSVRFGNVLGSRGSVVHAFTAQIDRGGPVTVTDPEVHRYFMLIPEACQLVLEAASIGMNGEVLVLDMGEQVKILEVAETLIRMSGREDVEIVYTGLRQGEKLGEDLFSVDEIRADSQHPLVSTVAVPAMDVGIVRDFASASQSDAMEWMRTVCRPRPSTEFASKEPADA